MDLGELLGTGHTAEIYAWGTSQVLKLFHAGWPEQAVEYEAQVSRLVYESGVPAPRPGELVRIGARLGLEYERVDGPQMGEVLLAEAARRVPLTRLFADLHARMHMNEASSLPAQRRRLELAISRAAGLSEELKAEIIALLHSLPDGNRLCHGDYHPYNILLTPTGPAIIDWNDATRGNPQADVARTLLLHETAAALAARSGREEEAELLRWFMAAYLERYGELMSLDHEQLALWRRIVAAGRLSEGVAEEQELLLAIAAG